MSLTLLSFLTGTPIPLPDYDLMVLLLLLGVMFIMKKSRESRECKPALFID